MNKNLLIGLVLAISFFGFMWWDSFSGSKEFPKEIRPIFFTGVFVRSFDDPNQRSQTYVVFDDSSKQNFDAYYSSLKSINPGDTLIKLGNTLKLVVKNGVKHEIFYPSFFGETFYDSTTQ